MNINLQAVSLKELTKTNHKKFKKRGLNCIMHAIDFEKKSDELRFLFLVQGLENYSKSTGHIVSIVFKRDTAAGKLKSRPINDDVLVHCQCPSFVYWGAAFNSTEGGYNLDQDEDRAPEIRDPNREVKICKHIERTIISIRNLSYRFLEKRSGMTTASLTAAVEDEYGFIPIKETYPAIISYLERSKPKLDARKVISSITDENYEQTLLSLGAIK